MSTFILVTGGYDTQIRLFDATNQTAIRTIQFCDQQVLRLAFSGRGPVSVSEPLFLAVAGSPSIAVYDVSTNDTSPNLFTIFQGHAEAVTAVGFEPYHTAFVYSASEDGTLQTWIPELASGQAFAFQAAHPMLEASKQFPSVPAKFVNDGPDGVVAIHDATYYPPLDLFFTVDYIGRLRVWDHAAKTRRSEHIPHASKRNLQCLELSSDHRTLVMANFDGLVFIYNVEHLLFATDPCPLTFRANSSYIPRVRLSVSSNLLVCTTRSGAIKVFRMADIMARNGMHTDEDHCCVTPIREFTGDPGWIWDAAFVEDREDYFFTCSSNTQVMLWDLNNLQQSNEYSGHDKAVVCLAVRERIAGNAHPAAAAASEEVEELDDVSDVTPHVQTDAEIGSPVTEAGAPQSLQGQAG